MNGCAGFYVTFPLRSTQYYIFGSKHEETFSFLFLWNLNTISGLTAAGHN